MTAPTYSMLNDTATIATRLMAASEVIASDSGSHGVITMHAQPANAEAAMYFQTAPTTGPIPSPIGRLANQSAGIVSTQNETTHATATPTGPHRSATRNSRPVTVNSTAAQRHQRSARPMDRWIQP